MRPSRDHNAPYKRSMSLHSMQCLNLPCIGLLGAQNFVCGGQSSAWSWESGLTIAEITGVWMKEGELYGNGGSKSFSSGLKRGQAETGEAAFRRIGACGVNLRTVDAVNRCDGRRHLPFSCTGSGRFRESRKYAVAAVSIPMASRRVLVVNAGSSSLKFKLYDVVSNTLQPIVGGLIERIGDIKKSSITIKV